MPHWAATKRAAEEKQAAIESLGDTSQERETCQSDSRTSASHNRSACRPACEQPEQNACYMQQTCSNHKTESIGKGICGIWQFGPMRMTVEDCKNSHDRRCNPQRWAKGKGHNQSQHDGRYGYSSFNLRNWHSKDVDGNTERHDHRKNNRQNPNRGPPQKRAPKTDSNHCHYMIPASYRMEKTAKKAAREPVRVGPDWSGGYKGERGREHKNIRTFR